MDTTLKAGSNCIDTAWSHVQLAQKLLDREQYKAAAAAAEAALALEPNYALAWLVRAQAYKALRRFAEAAEAFAAVVKFAPALAGVHVNLANTYAELDRFSDAETHLLRAIALKPGLAVAHASLGSIYMRMGRHDLAEAPCRQALALDPNLIAAHQNLADILARTNPQEAKVHRDATFTRQQIFVEASPDAVRTVLILATAETGNIPYQHLLPLERYAHIRWHIEYAPPGQDKDLPHYDFVFNAVADPDVFGPSQAAVERFVAKSTSPLINRPERVARTYRSNMPALLGHIDNVFVPPVLRHRLAAGNLGDAVRAAGIAFPIIVRPAGTHGGVGMSRVDSEAELPAAMPASDVVYASQFIDYRSGDGLYRKYRVIFVDRRPYPYHLAIRPEWLVHYKSAAMETEAERRAEEERFLSNPQAAIGARNMAALAAIAAELDLDYAGIDFSILPDGRLLVFEANATMLVHPESDPLLDYKNRAVRAICAAVDAMIEQRLQVGSTNAS
ncbi:MAG: tetratricopeptide repeat protein [Rhizomicrobium sp.]